MKYCIQLLGMIALLFLLGCGSTPPLPTATRIVAVATIVQPTATATPTATQTAVPATPTASPTPTLTPTATPDYPLYSGEPLKTADMGVQIHIHNEDLPQIFDHLQTLGVGWVKMQVSWKLYQPQPDRFDEVHWGELDKAVAIAHDRGLKVLLSVAKAPEWSRATTELDGPPLEAALYAAFMQRLAERYQGRVAAYELWNEPNLQREWNGATLNGADFVALIRQGAAGVRAADGEAILISGAPAPTGINDGQTAVSDRLFLRQMLEAGVTEFVDAVGIHPYGWANPPDSSVAMPETAVPSHNDHPTFFFKDTINDYTALLAEFGASDKLLWPTEFGWGSYDGWEAPPPDSVAFMANVTAWQQAAYTLRAFEMGQSNPQIGPMMLWNLNFGPLLGPRRSEAGFSLLGEAGEPRPVYRALAAAAKRDN